MDAAALVAEFLAGFTGNTAAAYRRDLACFLRFCHNHELDPVSARQVHLHAYLRALADAGRAPATLARRQVALRGFYGYLVDEQLLTHSPAARLRTRRPRSQSRIPSLNLEQLRQLLDAADHAHPRTSALVWLLATTGLRISEACHARLEDLTVEDGEGWLDVLCKGNLRRTIPLPDPTVTRIQALTQGRSEGPVFVTRTGAAWDRHGAARSLKTTAHQAGLEQFSPHLLRHTFVTLARQHGCALEDVQDAVGHADPATTRRYDHTPFTHQRHPAAQLLVALTAPTRADTHASQPLPQQTAASQTDALDRPRLRVVR